MYNMNVCSCTAALTKVCALYFLCVFGVFFCSVDSSRWFTWVVSWRAIKDLKAPFPDLKAGHVDHLLTCVP